MFDFLNPDVVVKLGAVYGALQAIAQAVMLFVGKNTIAFKIAKYVTSGPQRPPPEIPGDAG